MNSNLVQSNIMPKKRITLFEHQFVTYQEMGFTWQNANEKDRFLDVLEHLNKAASQEIFRVERKGLRANSMVGVVQVADLIMEILPKIDQSASENRNGAEQYASANRNLLAMLEYGYARKILPQALVGVSETASSWFELLTRLFIEDLAQQVHGGFSMEYVTREEHLPVLRGRWDVRRQISRHAEDYSTFEVTFDDLSADTPLNQVFQFVLEQLTNLPQEPSIQRLLADLSSRFSRVTRVSGVRPEFLEQVHFNRLNERFRPAFQLARMFLSGTVIRLLAGSIPAYAFVLDMDVLFERFLAAFLERHRAAIFPTIWRSAKIILQGSGAPLFMAKSEGRQAFRLRPDIILASVESHKPLLVVDTKYKELQPVSSSTGAEPGDIYQMLAYSLRLNRSPALLLYPQKANSRPVRKCYQIKTTGMKIFIATVNLHVPLDPPEHLIQELRDILRFVSP